MIGIKARTFDVGCSLSEPVKASIEEAIGEVLNELDRLGGYRIAQLPSTSTSGGNRRIHCAPAILLSSREIASRAFVRRAPSLSLRLSTTACLWPAPVHLDLAVLEYIRVGMSVSPFCCVLRSACGFLLWISSLRVRSAA